MRVRYTLPVRGILRVTDGKSIELHDFTFRFRVDATSGYVTELAVEIGNVDRKHWPTITEVEQDPNAKIPRFPFERNRDALNFSIIEPYILNLEGYLSLFGVDEIVFQQIKEEWIPDTNDERVSMEAGFSISPGPREPRTRPLNNLDLTKCILASGKTDLETEALSFFRMGQAFFHNRLYVDSIRYFYLFLEHLYANRKTSKKATLIEFNRASELKDVIQAEFLDRKPKCLLEIEGSRQKGTSSTEEFFEFIFSLRGTTQHARQSIKWHPSKQHQFKNEALCMIYLCDEICHRIVEKRLAAVPLAGS